MKTQRLDESRELLVLAFQSVDDWMRSNNIFAISSDLGTQFANVKQFVYNKLTITDNVEFNARIAVIQTTSLLMQVLQQAHFRVEPKEAFWLSFGAYLEQESKKHDEWRDKSLNDLYLHLKHEIYEIEGNLRDNELTFLVHNATDACMLAVIFLAAVRQRNPKKEVRP